ncbi:cobalamin-dependent protein, partial [candidate division WOR-3 bacterium]|nr:cobalamin-dependent protein [candidate division WOR-3 bacterium]
MKILLINPPDKNIISTNIPITIEDIRGFIPPLGIMYIASYAEKNTEHDIEILDTQVEEMSYEDIEKEIKHRRPDVVGITAMTFTLIDVILIAKIVKRIDEDIKVVLGGPHVNIYPHETINIPEVDYIVLGEG